MGDRLGQSPDGKTTWIVPGFTFRKLRSARAMEWLTLPKPCHADADSVHSRMTKSALAVFRAANYYSDFMGEKQFMSWLGDDLGMDATVTTSVVDKMVSGRMAFLAKEDNSLIDPHFATNEENHLRSAVDAYIRNQAQKHRCIQMNIELIERFRQKWRSAFRARPDGVLDGRLPPPRARVMARRHSRSPVNLLAAYFNYESEGSDESEDSDEMDYAQVGTFSRIR
jgi:hypothetical protein